MSVEIILSACIKYGCLSIVGESLAWRLSKMAVNILNTHCFGNYKKHSRIEYKDKIKYVFKNHNK